MFRPFLPALFILFCFRALPQESMQNISPTPVPDVSEVLLEDQDYQSLQYQWTKKLERSRNDAFAWYNLYKATRYEAYSPGSRGLSAEKQKELDELVKDMGKHVATSFEYRLTLYWNNGKKREDFPVLEKAYGSDPSRPEIYDEMIAYYERTGNQDMKKEFCKKLDDSGFIPRGIMEYNHNLLASVEESGILITHGEYDTYPALVLQETEGYRADVSILNLEMAEDSLYLEVFCKKRGLSLPAGAHAMVRSGEFLIALLKANPAAGIHVALSVPEKLYAGLMKDLYVTGLAMKYSPSSLDNLPLLEKKWKDSFRTAEMQVQSQRAVLELNSNYTYSLLLLYREYRKAGNQESASEVAKLLEKIRLTPGKEKKVTEILEKW